MCPVFNILSLHHLLHHWRHLKNDNHSTQIAKSISWLQLNEPSHTHWMMQLTHIPPTIVNVAEQDNWHQKIWYRTNKITETDTVWNGDITAQK